MMKKRSLIILVVVASALLLAGQVALRWWGYRIRARAGTHPYAAQSLMVHADDMLYFRHAVGQGLVDFTDQDFGEAEYRFRFRNADSGAETSGVGRVFERIRNLAGMRIVDTSKSQLWIRAGDLAFGWSYSSGSSSYVYYHSDRTVVYILPDSFFEKVDLARSTSTKDLIFLPEFSEADYAKADIRRYVFLRLSDQRLSVAPTHEEVVSVVDSNGAPSVSIEVPEPPLVPEKLTVGGIPLENYRRERRGDQLIFIDPEAFPPTDHAFIFPAGGWPHWFSLTIDAETGKAIGNNRPSTM